MSKVKLVRVYFTSWLLDAVIAATIAAVIIAIRVMEAVACDLVYCLFDALESKGIEKEFNALLKSADT